MDPDIRLLLKRNVELSEENNRILKSMRRSQRISSVMRVLYWIVIIAIGYFSLAAIQPYLDMLANTYSQFQGSGFGSSTSSFNWSEAADFLNKFKGGN